MRKVVISLVGWIGLCILGVVCVACSAVNPKNELTPTVGFENASTPLSSSITTPAVEIPTLAPSYTMTFAPTSTSTTSPTLEPSNTPTLAPSPTTSETPLPTVTPTYAILRGTILMQSNCRYGPGAAYLYKYGVYKDYYMDMIGRNETGTWVVVQAIGGNNPCWVKASLIDIKGNVMSLAPMTLPLPESPYYGPLTGVWAERDGDSVIISWNPLVLRAGDDSEQFPYLVEAWLCVDSQLVFMPIGSWETMLTVQDESGCSETSHARIFGVEKHGYTAWVTIPWPKP